MHSDDFPFDVIIANDNICTLASNYVQTMEEEKLLGFANDYEDSVWREKLFIEKIMDYLPLSALTAEERSKCQQKHFTLTKRAVNNLRCCANSTRDSSGEMGEILLYGIMQYYFHAAESVPKIFYKQNRNNLVTGADSIHIVVEDNDFSFWLGEAKFYEDIKQAMSRAVSSVKDMLDKEKLSKEKSYISGLHELRSCPSLSKYLPEIENILSGYSSVDNFRKKLHIPILLVCEDEEVKKAQELNEELRQKLRNNYIQSALEFFEKLKLSLVEAMQLCKGVKFHLILFPVPDIKKLNTEFADIKNFFTRHA